MMRTGIIYSYFLVALLFCSENFVKAQVQVTKGSIHHYWVSPVPDTATYNYIWSVTPGGTSSNFGTSALSNDILWDGATGLYTIRVYPIKPILNCTGSSQTIDIEVVGMNIEWSSTSSTQCPKTDNLSGDFLITANYIGVAGAWSFKYSIDGAAEQTVNIASGNSADITIGGFTNISETVPAIHTIRIISVTTPDNHAINYTGGEFDAASRLYTVTVDPTPNTSGIIQL